MSTAIPSYAALRERAPGETLRQHADRIRSAQTDHLDVMQRILRTAEDAGRATLRASEQRTYDEHASEDNKIGVLLRTLQNSPEGQRVDYSSAVAVDLGLRAGDGSGRRVGGSGDDPASRILGPEQRVADWVGGRGQVREEHSDLSLGALLRGWLTSRWDGAEAEQRALLEGTQAGGGVLVPTPLSAQIIDRARNVSRCFQAGARVVPMDSQTLKVPRISGSPSPAWRAENATIAEGDLTFDSVVFTAKSLALIVRASRELIEDGRDVDNVVRNDLAAQVAVELDRVMLRGTGTSPEPRGVRNTSGIVVTAFGGANGAAPTNYDHLLDAVQVIRGGNFEPNAVITAPRSETTLSKIKDSTGQYVAPPAQLAGIQRLSTNQIPVNLTAGTSTDTTEIYVGDWSKLWLGVRTELVLGTLVERYADVGQIAFLLWYRADVQIIQPPAFNVITGVRP